MTAKMRDSARKRAAIQNFWSTYYSVFAKRGLNLTSRLGDWSGAKRESLDPYSSRKSFDDLCGHGCKELPLAVAMAIAQPLRSFERKWKQTTGTARQRQQRIRVIEKAAATLEGLLGSLADSFVEDWRGFIAAESREEIRQEMIRPIDDWPTWAPMSDPAVVIRDLRTYASFLQLFELTRNDTAVASAEMVAKYLFSAYVFRATGQFHDAGVSVLIGAVLGVPYDETAHRMWRNRNYKRIDKKLSGIADMLTDLATAAIT
jgi:hypothetical protein